MFSSYEQYIKHLAYFDTEDGRIAYFDQGQGPCIVLLHGVPTSSWLYRKIIPILLKQGYRVVAPDMLGYGQSDKPGAYALYAENRMGQRLLNLMDFIGIESWSHVFHDGGGLWTWELLALDKSRIEHLFMLNTIVYQKGFNPPLKFGQGIFAKLFTRLYSLSEFTQLMTLNPTFKNGIKNKSVINANMLEGYKKPLLQNGHHALYYFFSQTKNQLKDYCKLHRSLKIALTVIWGKHDDILVWKEITDQVKSNFGILDDDIHLLDAKHFVQEEQPQKISEIILKKLKKR